MTFYLSSYTYQISPSLTEELDTFIISVTLTDDLGASTAYSFNVTVTEQEQSESLYYVIPEEKKTADEETAEVNDDTESPSLPEVDEKDTEETP